MQPSKSANMNGLTESPIADIIKCYILTFYASILLPLATFIRAVADNPPNVLWILVIEASAPPLSADIGNLPSLVK
jgi:hypothetical protein